MTESITINVEGMVCAACQSHVQRALDETPGVAKAAVNLMTGQAVVSFDPQAVATAQLIEAIRDTGYEAELPPAGLTALQEQENQDQAQGREKQKGGATPPRPLRDLTTNNFRRHDSLGSVAGIDDQARLAHDLLVVIVGMIGDDQNRIIFLEMSQRHTCHVQVVVAAMSDLRKIWIVVANIDSPAFENLDNRKRGRLA